MDIDPVSAVSNLATTIVSRIWPDKTQAEKDQLAQALAILQTQTDTNKAEAANPNMFVAGWRPFVGWVCGIGFAVQFVFGPLGEWASSLAGHPVKFPPMDLGTMMPLLLGMLGLGGMRTAEKIQGVNAGH